ncbi:MAG: carbohydrate kinase [Bacteroidetes bacterium]|nr:carbohydrate kinase [Bacteroidota bacterium]
MMTVAAIYDIGKTNKKLLCVDEAYRIVHEESVRIPEIVDEDEDQCEDLSSLTEWILSRWNELQSRKDFLVKAINVSAYGASFVHLDRHGKAAAPLYNYLKPYPSDLSDKFYNQFGEKDKISLETASPILGHLNSGMQLYWLKHTRPEIYERIAVSLHLPNFLSSLFNGRYGTEITSLGCHTQLWDYSKKEYHAWVKAEGLDRKMAPLVPYDHVVGVLNHSAVSGPGLHDSSSALIPYLEQFEEPFILLSTGTWNIALNPFNNRPLTLDQLRQDCLCYLSYKSKAVMASRLLAGHWYDEQLARMKEYFHVSSLNEDDTAFDPNWQHEGTDEGYGDKELTSLTSVKDGYHQIVQVLVNRQLKSLKLIMTGNEKFLYVDGGFSQNDVFMNLLARELPDLRVGAATIPQASALGAALSIHSQWNSNPKPGSLVRMKLYDH